MIRALFFDVDGVLTDGRVYLAGDGTEFKVFDTKDGHGIRKAIASGLKVAWISGRTSRATAARAKELGVHACLQGVRDKLAKYETLRRRWRLEPAETAAMGDDEPDVPMMEAAGFSACPADATAEARRAARLVLKNRGGRGAAREFIERVLRLNGTPSPRLEGRRDRLYPGQHRRGNEPGSGRLALLEDPGDRDSQQVEQDHRDREDALRRDVGGRRDDRRDDEDDEHRVLELRQQPPLRHDPHPREEEDQDRHLEAEAQAQDDLDRRPEVLVDRDDGVEVLPDADQESDDQGKRLEVAERAPARKKKTPARMKGRT